MPDPKNRPYIEPTRSDSLDLVKKSQAVNDFYIGEGYDYIQDKDINDPQQVFEELDARYQNFSNKFDDKVETYNTSGSSTISGVYEPRFYRKNDTGNTFSQRETADRIINFDAPMSGYNRSIAPHSLTRYSKDYGMVGDDFVAIPSYNILATTPADLLTDEQIVKRVEQFGSTSIPNSRLRKLGLPLNEAAPSASSLKRKKDRDTIDRQLKEAGLYNRAEGITGRNPDASRMYEEYMRSKQPSQSNASQVPNQVQSAGEAIKQPIEERIPEGYQLNLGYRGADGRLYGNTYNPTTSEGETYPVPGAPTLEDYKRIRAAEINPKRTGTRTVRADFAYGGRVVDKNVKKEQGYGKTGYKDVTYKNIFGQDVHKRTEYDGQDIKKTKTKKSDNKEVSKERNFWSGEGYDRTKEINKINNRGDIISKYEYNSSTPQYGGHYDLKNKTVLGDDGSYDYKEKDYNSGRDFGHKRTSKKVSISGEDFAYGGNVMGQGGPVYEAEGGEVIDGGNPNTLQGGHISPNSSTAGKIVGNSHGNGGVKMTGGEKIYSDRLTVDSSFLKDLDI